MQIGVVGAGVMGTGIAQAFAMADGNYVILTDVNMEIAEQGKKKIFARLNGMVSKGKLSEEACGDIKSRITVEEIAGLDSCNLIIEAIKEEIQIKRSLFAKLETLCAGDTIFASNTSVLSLTEMSMGSGRPIVGMHFFNPVMQMKLVEIVGSSQTPQELLDKVFSIAESIGKIPVRVNESSGFVVNRILIPMINEAIGVYSEGVASAADIDTAMRLGANHPIGPLALADLIGLDICLAIMQVLEQDLKNGKYRPHPLLHEMVSKRTLGRKTGSGFYEYEK